MDLQDIKKEIESLRKDTLNVNKSSEIYLFGLSKIKLALIFSIAALLVYAIKPVYIYEFEMDSEKEIKRRLNYKATLIVYLLCVTMLIVGFKYISFNF